ncbi:MAG: PQQ-like beta-propeller repeat protein [Planctomycetes bacterium]|nr:PQQ-like beta-propeller repeat protein [Planctomycetota bacterium]
MRAARLLAVVLPLFVVQLVKADDWPQWRGPKRDGVWRETGLVEKFSSDVLPRRWSVPIDAGYSGPTVAQGRVYVTDRVIEPKQIERVLCLDETSGNLVWKYEYECPYSIGYKAGPRASVSIDDGRAYALGAMGHLHCFDAATGTIAWQHDLNTEYKIRMPIWGIAASPLVDGPLVIVQIGGEEGACLVAFDKKTGQEVWRALDDDASYAAPIIIEQAGQRVLVCAAGQHVVGLNPVDGKLLWSYPNPPKKMVITIATPIVDRGRLFVSSFYDGSLMLQLDKNQLAVEKLWQRSGRDEKKTDALHVMIGTPILLGDYLYGVDSYGELRCLDAKTGDRVWESTAATPKSRWSTIHMVRQGDKLWMFNERGELLIARLSPSGFEEISRAQLIEPTMEQLGQRGGVCWSHPAFANKCVFARNDKELVCASLAAE